MFRTPLMIVPIALLALGGSTACATKKFVRTSVGEVNGKVDSMGRQVEETQERTRSNEAKIADVDQRAQAAAQAANQAANQAAQTAQTAGQSAEKANATATTAVSSANTAISKADALDKASKRLVFEVVLSEDQGNFAFGKKDLPDEAKARLDEMISALKADPKGAYFEIEGHTDSIGDTNLNERLGMERAEQVKLYLYEHHQIPLHKMSVISYGESKPAAENKTKAGRAQNRRVVIKVLA